MNYASWSLDGLKAAISKALAEIATKEARLRALEAAARATAAGTGGGFHEEEILRASRDLAKLREKLQALEAAKAANEAKEAARAAREAKKAADLASKGAAGGRGAGIVTRVLQGIGRLVVGKSASGGAALGGGLVIVVLVGGVVVYAGARATGTLSADRPIAPGAAVTDRADPTRPRPPVGTFQPPQDDGVGRTGAADDSAAPSGPVESYRLVKTVVTRTYDGYIGKPETNPIEPGTKEIAGSAGTFPFGWSYSWGAKQENHNRCHATLTLTRFPQVLRPGVAATFEARLDGQWDTKGYAVDRGLRIALGGIFGREIYDAPYKGSPSGEYSGSVTSKLEHVPSDGEEGTIVLTGRAELHYGVMEHSGYLEVALHYEPQPRGGR